MTCQVHTYTTVQALRPSIGWGNRMWHFKGYCILDGSVLALLILLFAWKEMNMLLLERQQKKHLTTLRTRISLCIERLIHRSTLFVDWTAIVIQTHLLQENNFQKGMLHTDWWICNNANIMHNKYLLKMFWLFWILIRKKRSIISYKFIAKRIILNY